MVGFAAADGVAKLDALTADPSEFGATMARLKVTLDTLKVGKA